MSVQIQRTTQLFFFWMWCIDRVTIFTDDQNLRVHMYSMTWIKWMLPIYRQIEVDGDHNLSHPKTVGSSQSTKIRSKSTSRNRTPPKIRKLID